MAVLFLVAPLVFFATGSQATQESHSLMRSEGSEPHRVAIDQHRHLDSLASVAEKQYTSSDPCSYLGCNSHTCAWASGGVITRLVARRGCSNALTIGTGAGDATAAHANATALTIVTLKDCVHAVRSQTGSCSGSFQLHKDTLTCSCVPTGGACTEKEDENVCRYQLVEQ